MSKHVWIKIKDFTACKKCGVVKRSDGKNSSCKGVVKITLRK